MRAAVCLLLAVGVLQRAGAQGTPQILNLREAAVAFRGKIPCPRWNCDCALKQADCCCGTSRMHKLEELTFSRLTNMWHSMKELDHSIQEAIGGRKVAFSASGIPSMHCFGPFSCNVSVPYKTVSLNHGDGYNPALGIFTAPRAGLYSFSFTVYSRRASAGDHMFYHLQLMRNGEVMASAWEENREDSEDSSSHSLLFPLERGGQVYVLLRIGRQLCGDTDGQNAFSGYMVHAMES